ncbi:F-box and WD domain protein [Cladophialophora carrionii]|uniref:F-box and WD domain protein n=1 Tax=Cladophialophora carrionii TaxID=86049 RepID=A0A1C1C8K5_9EURO|nr:F-box and WD domain protein [Cladophialophora carrionii]
MQSAPPEVPQNATSVDPSQQTPSPPAQHGLSHNGQQASGGTLPRSSPREPAPTLDDTSDSISVSSGGTQRGRSSHAGRLSRQHSSSQEGSPGSRIDEYERAFTKYRRPSDEMIFQIVPSAKDKTSTVSIEGFPNGAEALEVASGKTARDSVSDIEKTQRRSFTRLSALSSWRSEYILRTRLLRSLGRGRPAIEAISRSGAARHASSAAAAAVTTYASGLYYPVSHLHATFGVGLNKKQPMFMHGAVEQGGVTVSDPANGKPGTWGTTDFDAFRHFADQFPGELPYGLGPGNVVGMPNVMDISQPYGKVYGEALPGGRLFYTSTSEQRGRFVSISSTADHARGIPEASMINSAICSVWIAKSESVLKATDGLFGFLAGFSNGVLGAYALGVSPVLDRRYEKGEPTAKWVLCPGVPIIAICVDEKMSVRRLANHRIWAAVLNALGEVFYLTDAPTRPHFTGKASTDDLERLAWQTGRSVQWSLVEATRRKAKPDPFGTAKVDGSYSPRSSSDMSGLSVDQIIAETKEVEQFLRHKPRHFQNLCDGWDMQRRLIVDFAGDDHRNAGESVFVIDCGLYGDRVAAIRRFTRSQTKIPADFDLDSWPTIESTMKRSSLFGGSPVQHSPYASPALGSVPRSRTSSQDDSADSKFRETWFISSFLFAEHRNVHISSLASDDSEFAVLNVNEDPLLGMSGGSNASSPLSSPMGAASALSSTSEIPGRRARLFGIGTTSGVVMLWDMRAGLSPSDDVVNTIQPVRIIYTKSPQISSLALTSLYVVHGGNEGLVQAWDPLASSNEPIRTLNSRFSDRARRRIAQAEASTHGVGNNFYAAGAIVLDPDPTALRGMVSLGSYVRYWSYSSTAADAYKSRKRGQLHRRSERGSNSTPAGLKVSATGRGLINDYISNERLEIERDRVAREKERDRLTGRFGTNLLGEGASEEEMLAYATMLSEEAFSNEEKKRKEDYGSSSIASPSPPPGRTDTDADLEEAIRLSLLDSEPVSSSPAADEFNIPIRYAKSSRHGTPSKSAKAGSSKAHASAQEVDDLEFALQLSLAEEQSRLVMDTDFPALSPASSNGSDSGRGKGKSRRR